MKLNFICLLGLLLIACSSDDPVPTPPPPTVKQDVILSVGLPQFTNQKSRISFNDDFSSFVWTKEATVSLRYAIDQKQVENGGNLHYVIADQDQQKAKGKFVGNPSIKWEEGSSHHFSLLYPAVTGAQFPGTIEIEMPAQQNNFNSAEALLDYMLFTGDGTFNQPVDPAEIELDIQTAILEVNIIAAGTEYETALLRKLSIKAPKPLAGKGLFDLKSGTFSEFDIIELEAVPEEATEIAEQLSIYFAVFPQDMTAEKLAFSADIDGDIFEWEITADKAFSQGLNQIDLVMEGAQLLPVEMTDQIANSYIMKPKGSIHFPVSRPYDVLPAEFGETIGSNLRADVLWLDKPGGISREGVIREVTLLEPEKGRDAGIYVRAGSEEGNALVCLYDKDEIVWSWHIWVTDYDPEDMSGQKSSGNSILMDRNLGATSNQPGDRNAQGLMYQWGRKDPFPPADTRDISYPALWYDANGNEMPTGALNSDGEWEYEGNGVFYTASIYEEIRDNIRFALKNPNYFIYFRYWLMPPQAGCWTTGRYYSPPELRNDMWEDSDGGKTVFDPCPYGWRVPGDLDIFLTDIGPGSAKEVSGGYELPCGYFPATGYMDFSSGFYMDHEWAHIWHAKTGGYGGRALQILTGGDVYIPGGEYSYPHDLFDFQRHSIYRAHGQNVRCVKE